MANLVSADWLKRHLYDDDIVVVDLRGSVDKEELGGGRQHATYRGHREDYERAHIPGSVFLDWTQDIVDPDAEVKAQISTPEAFAATMEACGIGDDTHVVVADNHDGHIGARLWWALKYMGHSNVSMLDGGYAAWNALGGELSSDRTIPRIGAVFTPSIDPGLRVEWQQVLEIVNSGGPQLIDVRDAATFHGDAQRGTRGGHIPGALNFSAKQMVNEDGTWKAADIIRQMVEDAGIDLARPIVTYCNGGVTAAQAIVGLELAGATDLANYDGSWNEWGERYDLPVEENKDLFRSGDH